MDIKYHICWEVSASVPRAHGPTNPRTHKLSGSRKHLPTKSGAQLFYQAVAQETSCKELVPKTCARDIELDRDR
jgi:hypothetical protein